MAIEKLPNKQCSLDPIPTCLLKKIPRLISPFLTNVFNNSFSVGFVPDLLKLAHISLLLKKPSFDTNYVSSYRPILNSVLNKILERLVLAKVFNYLTENKFFFSLESAYHRHHSTETAISKIYSNILEAADNGQLSLLVLLDLSSAFDQYILLRRLEKSFGFGDIVLEWFTSYLTNRTFIIRCCERETCIMHSSVGVPQGFLLGPLLFIFFTGDLEKLIKRHNFSFHQFADGTQIYGHCRYEKSLDLQVSLSERIDDIAGWMEANHLKLNVSKTEAILFSNGRSSHKIPNRPVRIVADSIIPSKNVKTLGVWLDRDLSMKTHINMILKGGFIFLRQIKDLLSIESLKTLASALVALLTMGILSLQCSLNTRKTYSNL